MVCPGLVQLRGKRGSIDLSTDLVEWQATLWEHRPREVPCFLDIFGNEPKWSDKDGDGQPVDPTIKCENFLIAK